MNCSLQPSHWLLPVEGEVATSPPVECCRFVARSRPRALNAYQITTRHTAPALTSSCPYSPAVVGRIALFH